MREWDGTEGQAFSDNMDDDDEFSHDGPGEFVYVYGRCGSLTSRSVDSLRPTSQRTAAATITKIHALSVYEASKAAKTGATCTCPACGKSFVKKSYQQAFCSNKGRANCKDTYWNRASESRMARAAHFS